VKCLMREEGLVSTCAAAGVRKTGWNRGVGLVIVAGRVGRVMSVRRVRRASGENKDGIVVYGGGIGVGNSTGE
jgi:hypothetical protein